MDLNFKHFGLPLAHVDATLTMATKFGFMIETCILSVRTSKPLVCPVHAQYCPLSVQDLAPDLVRPLGTYIITMNDVNCSRVCNSLHVRPKLVQLHVMSHL